MKKGYKILGGVLAGLLVLLFLVRFFSTLGKSSVKVTSVDPLGQVDPKSNFTIEFSGDMVAANQMNVASDSLAVIFKPGIPGQYKWISPRRLRFFPNLPLRPATEYSLEILPEICTQPGIYLKGDRSFEFYTTPLQVDQCQLSAVSLNRKTSQIKIEFSLKFNAPIEPEIAQKSISLHTNKEATGDQLNFSLKSKESEETLIFESEPFTLKEKKQHFSVRVARGLVGLGGQLGLKDDFTRAIQVGDGEPLKLISIYPTTSHRTHSIAIKFSAEIAADEARAYISVEPKIDFQFQVQGRQVLLEGPFFPGQEYRITLKKGLPSQNLTVLEKELSQVVYIENLEPNVTFVDHGFYLPRKGNRQVGVETVNINKVEVEIYQIFENNLIFLLNQQNPLTEYFYFDTYGARYLGKKLFSEEIKIQSQMNEPVQTAIDLTRFLETDRKGIFSVVVRDVEYRWRSASKAVILTDIGLMAHYAADELLIWAHSLTDLKPVSGAQISFISVNNQLLASGATGPDGLLKISNLKEKTSEFEPFALVAAVGADLSFLQFQNCQLATSDFAVEGRLQLVEGYEAILYTDRGVYRPGETVHLVSVVRDKNLAVPPSFPIRLEIVAPDNRIFQEMRGAVGAGGACEFNIPFPAYAATGKYLAKLMVSEQELGRGYFSIEEFIPDRIKVTLKTDRDAYQTGETVPVSVQAVNLFGPPAAGRRTEAVCEIQEIAFQPEKYRSYTFSDDQKTFEKLELKLGEGVLDADGEFQFSIELPEALYPASSLRGVLSATVIEPGGRAVSAYKGLDIHPYPFYIGLRPQQEGYAEIGKASRFEFVVVDPAGNLRETRSLVVKVFNIVWHSILKRDDTGQYRYVSEFTENEIQSFAAEATGGQGAVQFTPQNYGEYRLQILDPESNSSTSVKFYASGWGYAPWSMSHPDRLEIEFDKTEYQAGETAKALIKAPFSGKLLLCIEREKVFETREVTLTENTASIELTVKEAYKPNVYLTGTLIRSIQSLEKHAPVRAFGTAPLMVNCQSQKLPVQMKAVSEMRPRNVLEVDITVPGTSSQAFLTLAAVDEGICQLTDFETPDLFSFFYAKRRLQVESFDFYNYILPEFLVTETSSSSAGDRLDGVRRKHLTPVDASRVKPVALWAGLVQLGSRGRAKIKLDVPEFNGKLRLMAVAFDGANFGNASQQVTVRNPIVLMPTFPRFVAPKDSFRVPVSVFNGTGKTAAIQVNLQVTGAARINNPTANLNIPDKGEATAIFQVAAREGMGALKFLVTAEGNGESVKTEVEIPLRPPVPLVSQTGSGVITSKPVQIQIPANWLPGTETYQITTSGFPTLQFGGNLQYLLHYPYGCIEQTTSQVFPLLYFKEMALAAEPEMFKNSTVEYFLEEGIQRISNMQLASGGFAYWPGGTEPNAWGSIYATHFLVEARKAGFSIPDRVYDKALAYLREPGFSMTEFLNTNEIRTYTLYVLSVAGQPDKSSMIYLKNNVLNEMGASSKYLLAGAFGLTGDLKTAGSLLPVTIQPQSLPRETGGIFDSSVRTNAIILNVLAELFPQNPSVPVLAKWLANEVKSSQMNTQENAWALLALGKTLKKNSQAQFTGKIQLDSKSYAEFGIESKTFSGAELGGKKIEFSLEGTGPAYFYWQAEGIPRDLNIEERDHGLSVRRVLLNRDGKPLDYQQIRQGDLVVAQISMTALDKPLDNVIVADLLPAGLEIENPRLESRADVAWIKDQEFMPDYMDIRDDRLILFINLPERKEQKFYYALRAVTAGQFTLPPIKAEAMYDPVYRSVASSGVVRVREMR